MINKIKEWSGLVALIAIVLFLIFGQHASSTRLGGVTNYDEVDATAFKAGGANGSRFGPLIFGACTPTYSDSQVTASTTKAFDCPVTGVVAGDSVFVTNASTTPTGSGNNIGMFITGASASSTSGFVTLRVTNFGVTANLPYGIASSTSVLVLHPVTTVPGL